MVPSLAAKDNAKLAWDAIKTMRVGVDRVRQARRQKLRKLFDGMSSQSGESIEDLSLRISNLVAELQSLGDATTELDAVEKLLRIAPKRYSQMACSIETLLDLSTLSLEEVSGRLSASEGRGEPEPDAGGKLLLTEEEWRSRFSTRDLSDGQSSGGGKNVEKGKRPQGRPSGDGSGGKGDAGGKPPRRNGKCNYCGIEGHWARECRKAKRERGDRGKREEQAHLVQGQDDAPAMLLAEVGTITVLDPPPATPVASTTTMATEERVFLNEERVVPIPSNDERWYLDTGASNHMTGTRSVFSKLDCQVKGSVRFGDGSVVEIEGRGSVLFV